MEVGGYFDSRVFRNDCWVGYECERERVVKCDC